jgi:hypothetical protein
MIAATQNRRPSHGDRRIGSKEHTAGSDWTLNKGGQRLPPASLGNQEPCRLFLRRGDGVFYRF